MSRRNRIEHDHQVSFFSWLRLNEKKHGELRWFYAIPNGGRRDHGVAVSMFLEGVRAGVLDTHLPLARHGKAGLWIEFKAPGGALSKEQRGWIQALEAEGHEIHVVQDWIEAARITAAYLDLAEFLVVPRPRPASVLDQQRRRITNDAR
jgi:hypothetical protein